MINIVEGNVVTGYNGLVVHGCNCQGAMGSGVAAEVRRVYPEVYQRYLEEHAADRLILGNIDVVEVNPGVKWIVNAYTQDSYGAGRRQVSYDAMYECFVKVGAQAQVLMQALGKMPTVVFPMIGAGLGGGDWEIIKVIIERALPEEALKLLVLFK